MSTRTSMPLVDLLSKDQRAALEVVGTPVNYPGGRTIFGEGQPSHSALIIREGTVKVTRVGFDGAETILTHRGPGEILGDEGVLMDEPRSATVTAVTDVIGLDLRADVLMRFLHDQDVWPAMYRMEVKRRRQSDDEILLAKVADVKSRLARWLLELAVDVGVPAPGGGREIEWQLSQEEIARRIGAKRDSVAIALRGFRERKLVTTGRKRIILLDLEELRKIASSY